MLQENLKLKESATLEPKKRGLILLSIPYQMVEQGELSKNTFDVIFTTLSFALGAGNTGFPKLTNAESDTVDQLRLKARNCPDKASQISLFLKELENLKSRVESDKQDYYSDCVAHIQKLLIS